MVLLQPLAMQETSPLKRESFENQDIKYLQQFFYLIPVFGFFPALWMLYRRRGNREQQALSRLVITLTLGWLLGYILLATGSQSSEGMKLPLLIASSLLTSGYFLVNIWLMVRLWRRRPPRLLWVSRISEQFWRKYLS